MNGHVDRNKVKVENMNKYLKYIPSSILVVILLCSSIASNASSVIIQGATVVASITDAQAIYGFTYSNNATDVVNDIDIAAGGAIDSLGTYLIVGAASTKQTDVVWAVGTNAGCLDTGVVGNSDYYLFVIERSDTLVVDYLCSLSNTAPNIPANYNHERLIGWIKRVGGTVVAFTTYQTEGGGLEFLWTVPTLDINLAATLTTSRRTDAVKVPLNFSVIAHLNVYVEDTASITAAIVYCPDQSDVAPSNAIAPLGTLNASTTLGGIRQMFVRTSAAGLIAARSTVATTDLYRVVTNGFKWSRR